MTKPIDTFRTAIDLLKPEMLDTTVLTAARKENARQNWKVGAPLGDPVFYVVRVKSNGNSIAKKLKILEKLNVLGFDLNSSNNSLKASPVYFAAVHIHEPEIVKFLLESGANGDFAGDGQALAHTTPLHRVITNINTCVAVPSKFEKLKQIAELLLSHGYHGNITDKKGMQAIHMLAEINEVTFFKQIVVPFARHQANFDAVTDDGQTLFGLLAKKHEDPAAYAARASTVLEALKEHGATITTETADELMNFPEEWDGSDTFRQSLATLSAPVINPSSAGTTRAVTRGISPQQP